MQLPLPFQLLHTLLDGLRGSKPGKSSVLVCDVQAEIVDCQGTLILFTQVNCIKRTSLILVTKRVCFISHVFWKLWNLHHMFFYFAPCTGYVTLSQGRGINTTGLRGDLIVFSAVCPRHVLQNKAWWGTHAVAVVIHECSDIFPTGFFFFFF